MSFYLSCLSDELKESVSAQLKQMMPEQLALNQEVALLRERNKDLARRWSLAREHITLCETLPPGPERDKAVRSAHLYADAIAENMASAIKDHKDVAVSASVIEAKSRENLGEQTIMMFLNAVMELVNEKYNDGTATGIQEMEVFEKELRERIVIQKADNRSLAIEGEIFAMFNTIPGPQELIAQ